MGDTKGLSNNNRGVQHRPPSRKSHTGRLTGRLPGGLTAQASRTKKLQAVSIPTNHNSNLIKLRPAALSPKCHPKVA